MKHKRYRKKITAAALACAITASFVANFTAIESLAAWNKMNGMYQMADGTAIHGVVSRGIDVSHWKQNIDWQAVAADDVQFVMLGTRYANDVDPFFRINAEGAIKNGIQIGAYIYSYATTPEMAVAEADFVLDLIKDYPISFPVAFDVEANVQSTLAPAELSAIINAFCEKIEAAGYHPMLYANDYWLANKIDMSLVDYDVWVARYEIKHNYSNPVMWQATSTGSVNGVEGNVDINFLYQDLSSKIPANLWRTIGDKTYYYQDYVMQKDNWIHDGSDWYYMNAEGLASKGWLNQASGSYYLDESSGKMITGWKNLDNAWYYFAGSGAMATGWIDDAGNRYYLDSDGKMTTGWRTDNNKKYFLKDNGVMATGWRPLDNAWYYFGEAGDMASGWINPDGYWYYLAADGRMQNGWLTDNGAKYYLSDNSGRMTVGWREVDGSWYYFDGSGAMVTGLTEVNGKQYYLNPADGKMASNTEFTLDGVLYRADESGVCAKVEAEQPETAAEGAPEGEDQNQPGGQTDSQSQQNSGGDATSNQGYGPGFPGSGNS